MSQWSLSQPLMISSSHQPASSHCLCISLSLSPTQPKKKIQMINCTPTLFVALYISTFLLNPYIKESKCKQCGKATLKLIVYLINSKFPALSLSLSPWKNQRTNHHSLSISNCIICILVRSVVCIFLLLYIQRQTQPFNIIRYICCK